MLRIVSVLALIVGLPLAALAADVGEPRRITVSGQGQVSAAPDMATLTLGVTHTDKEAQVAMAKVSEDVSRILTRLTQLGIAAEDMQTRNLNLSPLWTDRSSGSGDQPAITGFSASNMVMVRVQNLDRLGDLLDAVLSDGANAFQGLRFGLQDPDPLADAARKAAVVDAMARATLLAEAAGVPLGHVLTITDQSGVPHPQMMEMATARGGGTAIAAGEVTVEATVTMVFAIGE
ncbi:MAG: SIMPL domain-containing protein [Paracoccaceae bacterium]